MIKWFLQAICTTNVLNSNDEKVLLIKMKAEILKNAI